MQSVSFQKESSDETRPLQTISDAETVEGFGSSFARPLLLSKRTVAGETFRITEKLESTLSADRLPFELGIAGKTPTIR